MGRATEDRRGNVRVVRPGGGRGEEREGETNQQISTTKKQFGLCNLADEIQTWMMRAELGGRRRDGSIDNETKAIVDEFREEQPRYDQPQLKLGGAAGGMQEGAVESWFKERGSPSDDPSGVLERAERYAQEAAKRNMSYLAYVAEFVKRPVRPTVETLRPYSAPPRPPGVERLVTTPHSYPGARSLLLRTRRRRRRIRVASLRPARAPWERGAVLAGSFARVLGADAPARERCGEEASGRRRGVVAAAAVVYTLVPRVPYSACWYGLFFEVPAAAAAPPSPRRRPAAATAVWWSDSDIIISYIPQIRCVDCHQKYIDNAMISTLKNDLSVKFYKI